MNKNIQNIKKKILNREPLTSHEKRTYINYALTRGSDNGKMHDFTMLTTSCLYNPLCQARRKNNELICASCYSDTQLKMQKNTRDKFFINSIFFSEYELRPEDIPIIYTVNNVLRFDSHGDCINRLNAKNYYAIARKNNHLHCAIWSKNPWLYKGLRKPENIKFVYSIAKLNQIANAETLNQVQKKYPFVDKIFAVYTPQFIEDNRLTVNCGGRDCMNCLTCYKSNKKNIVIEKLK